MRRQYIPLFSVFTQANLSVLSLLPYAKSMFFPQEHSCLWLQ
uniref:Uncharacterized protein n=1 Tax=Arundo donax TaxID=35708 RepID=A0A0A8YAY2_ARUDO